MSEQVSVNDLLTVIITTSVTPSAPSTELLEAILESFDRHCPALLSCKVIVVFDGYDKIVPTARLKKGQVTSQQAENFTSYKQNVKNLILGRYQRHGEGSTFTNSHAKAEYGSTRGDNEVSYTISQTCDKSVTFIEPSRRLGFGLAVRSALRVTDTPFVWIQQHDWTLLSDLPIEPMLQIMKAHESDLEVPIKYICLAAVRMLSYATSMDVARFPALRNLTASLTGDFSTTSHPDAKVPLTPMYFWHDKPHLASTVHYLNRVFPSRLAMFRGDFIEDKIGQRARAQMKEGEWNKWATWLYYPEDGKQLCLRHLQGRTRESVAGQADKAAMWKQRNELRDVEKESSVVKVDVAQDLPLFLEEEEQNS